MKMLENTNKNEKFEIRAKIFLSANTTHTPIWKNRQGEGVCMRKTNFSRGGTAQFNTHEYTKPNTF